MEQFFVWTFSDAVAIVVVLAFALVFGFLWIMTFVEQALCSHDRGVTETQACDAICRKCGKNLGFIGAWREKNKVPNA